VSTENKVEAEKPEATTPATSDTPAPDATAADDDSGEKKGGPCGLPKGCVIL
jgi:hypothetical protein